MKIVMSSGHGLKIRGASCDQPWGLDEVDEARRVVETVSDYLRDVGYKVTTFHDDVSTTQNENLHRIVDFHNAQERDLDVSVHFNAYVETTVGRGTEVLYLTQEDLAKRVVDAISNASGLINRGPKKRTDLFFLNSTDQPAILIETCFVDSKCDADLYHKYYNEICKAIALCGNRGLPQQYQWEGKVSYFGGPDDEGVDPDEGLAFIYEVEDQPDLFLPEQPPGTTGLARRLDPDTDYIAMRWDYSQTPREQLLSELALVRVPKSGLEFYAYPADWGPADWTGRVADISPGLMSKLEIVTDDSVQVTFPARRVKG
jgi:N-acetylmuramoyl-L-alanine amidase-like protein